MFARNIKIQQLNEESEYRAIKNITEVLKVIGDRSFDFFVQVDEPTQVEGQPNQFKIPVMVTAKLNSNFQNYLFESLQAISMTRAEVNNYIRLNKDVYKIVIFKDRRSNAPVLETGNYANLVDGKRDRFDFMLDDRSIFAIDWNDDENALMYGYFGNQNKPDSISELYSLVKKDIKEYLSSHFSLGEFYLRNSKSDILVKNLIHYLVHSLQNFEVENGVDTFTLYDKQVGKRGSEEWEERIVTVTDYPFRPALIKSRFDDDVFPRPLMRSQWELGSMSSIRLNDARRVNSNKNEYEGNDYYISTYDFIEKLWKSIHIREESSSMFEAITSSDREASELGGSFNVVNKEITFLESYWGRKRRPFDEQLAIERNFPFYSLLDAFGTEKEFGTMLYKMVDKKRILLRNEFMNLNDYAEKWEHDHSKHKSISIFSFVSFDKSESAGTSAIFKFDDIRSLDELNNITGYSVFPIAE